MRASVRKKYPFPSAILCAPSRRINGQAKTGGLPNPCALSAWQGICHCWSLRDLIGARAVYNTRVARSSRWLTVIVGPVLAKVYTRYTSEAQSARRDQRTRAILLSEINSGANSTTLFLPFLSSFLPARSWNKDATIVQPGISRTWTNINLRKIVINYKLINCKL